MQYNDVEAAVKADLGGSLPGGIALRDIADMAGEYLLSRHSWTWATTRTGLIDLRGGLSVTAGTWTESTRTLTSTGTFADYTFVVKDQIEITGGTNATTGFYEIESKTDSDNIVLARSIGSAANGSTDITGSVTLNSVALPSDFAELISITPTGSFLYGIQQVTLAEILGHRASSTEVAESWPYRVAINYAGEPAEPILEIWPSPTSNQIGDWMLFYRRRWLRAANDNSDLMVPELGPYRLLYLEICKAIARGYAEADEGTVESRLREIDGGALMQAAKRADGAVQVHHGLIQNGGAERQQYRRSRHRGAWLATFLGAPS